MTTTAYWDEVSAGLEGHYYHGEVIGSVKRQIHLNLIWRWVPDLGNKTILKTDLFEEAHGADQFLFELQGVNSRIFGMDISFDICQKARDKANARQWPGDFLTADLFSLPLSGNGFDLIVSNSTLDHFPDFHQVQKCIAELYRILKPGGSLILTLDNPHSFSYMVSRLKGFLRPDPFYMGKTCSAGELKKILIAEGFEVAETAVIMHGLENHTSLIMSWLRKIHSGRWDQKIRSFFLSLEKLETFFTKYLTGAFIAARAVKPANL